MFSIQPGFLIGVKCPARNPCNALIHYLCLIPYNSTACSATVALAGIAVGPVADRWPDLSYPTGGGGRETIQARLSALCASSYKGAT